MDKINKMVFGACVTTCILTLVTFIMAFMTPPLSGPFCASTSCYTYPYLDIANRFPRDYWWMFIAILQLIVLVIFITVLHLSAPSDKKTWSLAGLIFAVVSVAILLSDYFVQVSVVQPSVLKGETGGIALLSQYNPHGIFIALEELGYLLMSLGLGLMAPVLGADRLSKIVKWIFVSCLVLTVLSFAAIIAAYGINREYRFEIASITFNWIALILGSGLLSVVYYRSRKEGRIEILHDATP
ncbi:MAG: hypothetical protein KW802_02635 [Candidatus Doudnabacteria bacterium]|nr:hypothetical protein [Candidatus Doudnabacteria bacterium]